MNVAVERNDGGGRRKAHAPNAGFHPAPHAPHGDEAGRADRVEGCDVLDVCGAEKRLCTRPEVARRFSELRASASVADHKKRP